jgi:flagellar operon protein (TIGR03826 family)
MEVRNCSRCGKIYVYVGQRLCPHCFEEEEALFQRVEKYLREHPGANLEAVAEGTNIAKEIILDFIRRGRLITLKAEGLLRCEICGRPIDQGRICQDCAGELKQGLQKKVADPAVDDNREYSDERMHIADLLQRKGNRRR